MTAAGGPAMLRAAMEQTGFDISALWIQYLALGGTASLPDLEAHVNGVEVLDSVQHDMVVHALNERFVERDMNHPVPYLRD